MKANSGLGFAEVMIGMLILSLLIAGSVKLSTSLIKGSQNAIMSKAGDRDMGNMMETVLKNFNQQQISFVALGLQASDAKLDEMPLSWNDKVLVPRDQCLTCPGRMGVVARPHPSIPGVFVVKMKISNRELFSGPKEYRFLAVQK